MRHGNAITKPCAGSADIKCPVVHAGSDAQQSEHGGEQVVVRQLGIALPGSAAVPAVDPARARAELARAERRAGFPLFRPAAVEGIALEPVPVTP